MGRILIIITTLLTLIAITSESTAASSNGEQLFSDQCTACHGSESGSMTSPLIQGQLIANTAKELREFRSGTRADHIMGVMPALSSNLSDQDITDIAVYLKQANRHQKIY